MIVSSMPSASANTACAFGAAWYIGAVTSVFMPGRSPIAASVVAATCWDCSEVIASRRTPLARPVVPEV